MPHKFNDARRDKFATARYRVTNAAEYDESLRRRGDLTIWVADDVAQSWAATRRQTRGGQALYSDLAIEICLTLRVVFRLPLRQTQGFTRSIVRLMDLNIAVPDFSTLSRRGKGLRIVRKPRSQDKPITLIVDSTGLRMHGGSDWNAEKHGLKKPRKSWRKLHMAFDPESGAIIDTHLTTEHVGDETALPDLLSNTDADVDRFLADGAYDGQGVSACLLVKFGPDIEVVIPPPSNAVPGDNPQRNRHIDDIAALGRMGWQKGTSYNQRALIEAQIGRWKTAIGDGLQARHFDNQVCEVSIAAKALNRMTELGRATYDRVF